MKLKQLEGLLGNLQQFSDPKVELEQYPTGPHIASRLLYTAENTFGDVSGKVVADFGCGCGTLGVAGALLGAEHVIGIDIDPQSLEIASLNAADLELDIDLIQCDIKNLGWRGQLVDTVVMNPPFGTRKKGSDMEFLFMALKVASQAVYSLHKSTTRDHIKRTALRDCNAKTAEVLCEVYIINASFCFLYNFSLVFAVIFEWHVAEPYPHRTSLQFVIFISLVPFVTSMTWGAMVLVIYFTTPAPFGSLRFDVPHLYKFHKKKEVDIAVDLWRFVP